MCVACKQSLASSCDVSRRPVGIHPRRRSLLTGGTMRHTLACCVAAAAIPAAACSDQLGPSRRLIPNLGATADSSADSTPGGKPGPVASVTVTPPSDTVPVGRQRRFLCHTARCPREPHQRRAREMERGRPERREDRGGVRAVAHLACPAAWRHRDHGPEPWKARLGPAGRGGVPATSSTGLGRQRAFLPRYATPRATPCRAVRCSGASATRRSPESKSRRANQSWFARCGRARHSSQPPARARAGRGV